MAQPKIKDNAIDDNITADKTANVSVAIAGDTMTGTLKIATNDGFGGRTQYQNVNAAADTGKWQFGASGTGRLGLTMVDDAEGTFAYVMDVQRTGMNADSVAFTSDAFTFSSNIAVTPAAPTAANHLARMDYVDNAITSVSVTILDTPIQLFNGASPPAAATPLTDPNLAGKSKAILRCKAIAEIGGTGAVGEQTEVIGQVGSSSTLVDKHRVAFANAVKQGSVTQNIWAYDTTNFAVNLDGSSQFWYNTSSTISTNGTVWFEIWLVGWYN